MKKIGGNNVKEWLGQRSTLEGAQKHPWGHMVSFAFRF